MHTSSSLATERLHSGCSLDSYNVVLCFAMRAHRTVPLRMLIAALCNCQMPALPKILTLCAHSTHCTLRAHRTCTSHMFTCLSRSLDSSATSKCAISIHQTILRRSYTLAHSASVLNCFTACYALKTLPAMASASLCQSIFYRHCFKLKCLPYDLCTVLFTSRPTLLHSLASAGLSTLLLTKICLGRSFDFARTKRLKFN